MKIFDQIKTGDFLSPSTIEGAILYGVCFAVAAWPCTGGRLPGLAMTAAESDGIPGRSRGLNDTMPQRASCEWISPADECAAESVGGGGHECAASAFTGG